MDLDHFADDSNQVDLYVVVVVAVVLLVLIFSFVENVNFSHEPMDLYHFADDSNQMDVSPDEQTIAGISRRRTRPQLNFLAILADYGVTLDASCREELCQKLYDGVYSENNRRKYFVDKESNKNCFVLFARELFIKHAEDSRYWRWIEEEEASGELIEVAELVWVQWLEITGTVRTIDLSLETMYEIVFVVKKLDSFSNFSLELALKPPQDERPQQSNLLTHSASLEQKPSGEWFEILVVEFMMSPKCVGIMEFALRKHDHSPKKGFVVKCAIIRPKK